MLCNLYPMQQEWLRATFDAKIMHIRLGQLPLPAKLDLKSPGNFWCLASVCLALRPFLLPVLFCACAAPSPLACASSAAQTALLHCPPASLLLRRSRMSWLPRL